MPFHGLTGVFTFHSCPRDDCCGGPTLPQPSGFHLSHRPDPEPRIDHLVLSVADEGLFLLDLVDEVVVKNL